MSASIRTIKLLSLSSKKGTQNTSLSHNFYGVCSFKHPSFIFIFPHVISLAYTMLQQTPFREILTAFFPPSSGNPRSGSTYSSRLPTAQPGLGLPQLDGTVYSLAALGLSSSTSRSYKSGVHCYTTFWNTYNLTGFPLTESVLCRFVAFLVQDGLSYSSIRQDLSSLRHTQLCRVGLTLPSHHCTSSTMTFGAVSANYHHLCTKNDYQLLLPS